MIRRSEHERMTIPAWLESMGLVVGENPVLDLLKALKDAKKIMCLGDPVRADFDRDTGFRLMPVSVLNLALDIHKSREKSVDLDLRNGEYEEWQQISVFLASGVVETIDDIDQFITLDRLDDLYRDWCSKNALMPYYGSKNSFPRAVFVCRPDWRNRRKRIRINGVQKRVLLGLKEVAK